MSIPAVKVVRSDREMTVTLCGPIQVAHIIETIQREYPSFAGSAVLWDFSPADVSALDPRQFGSIAAAASTVMDGAVMRKTAYVVTDGPTYVKACRYLNEAVNHRLPSEYAVFTSADAARKWLHGE